MNKQAFLEETYNSAFNDELEKISMKTGKVLLKEMNETFLGKLNPFNVSRRKKFFKVMSKGERSADSKVKKHAKEMYKSIRRGDDARMDKSYKKVVGALDKSSDRDDLLKVKGME